MGSNSTYKPILTCLALLRGFSSGLQLEFWSQLQVAPTSKYILPYTIYHMPYTIYHILNTIYYIGDYTKGPWLWSRMISGVSQLLDAGSGRNSGDVERLVGCVTQCTGTSRTLICIDIYTYTYIEKSKT